MGLKYKMEMYFVFSIRRALLRKILQFAGMVEREEKHALHINWSLHETGF